MEQIQQIYYNDFGISFYWKKEGKLLIEKIQLVFKEIGFYFSPEELRSFFQCINLSDREIRCSNCDLKNTKTKFLLKTPCESIDLAVSARELYAIEDLIRGTLFQIQLNHYLNELCGK